MADAPMMRRTCMVSLLSVSFGNPATVPLSRFRPVGFASPGFPGFAIVAEGSSDHSPELQSQYRHTCPKTSVSYAFLRVQLDTGSVGRFRSQRRDSGWLEKNVDCPNSALTDGSAWQSMTRVRHVHT